MLIIFGTRGKGKLLRQEMRPCSICQRKTVQLVAETSQWFALFFIPIFPFSRNYIRKCAVCGNTERLTKEEALSEQPPEPMRPDVCANCGARIAPEAIERGDPSCVLCGHPLPRKPQSVDVCPHCGTQIPPEALTRGDKFCTACGQPLPGRVV